MKAKKAITPPPSETVSETILPGEFMDRVSDLLSKAMEEAGKILQTRKLILEFDNSGHQSHMDRILRLRLQVTEILNRYEELLPGSITEPADFISILLEKGNMEMANLDAVLIWLKAEYIKHHSVNTMGIKVDDFAKMYDFKGDSQAIAKLAEILRIVFTRLSSKLIKPEYLEGVNFEKESSLPQQLKSELKEDKIVYANREDASWLMSLQLLCAGLNNTKEFRYSFKELPEINFRLLKVIQINSRGALEVNHTDLRKAGLARDIGHLLTTAELVGEHDLGEDDLDEDDLE